MICLNIMITPGESMPSSSKYDALRSSLTAQPKTWLVTGVAGFVAA